MPRGQGAGWTDADRRRPEPVRSGVAAGKLEGFGEPWSPRIVAAFNGHDVMVVARGAFVWHAHPDTDDLFLVLKGRLRIEMRGRTVSPGPGELFVVPRGVEHRPVA